MRDTIYYQDKIITAAKKYGFKLFTGDLNVNIWGIREDLSNYYNDTMIIFEMTAKGEFSYYHIFKAATNPGKGWLGKIMGNWKGTFVLMANSQYRGCWQIGKHRGYTALVQPWSYDKFIGYRDNNKDGDCDLIGELYTDVKGLNFHCNNYPEKIAKASAGCQVAQYWDDFNKAIDRCQQSSRIYGNSFSYTLINANILK